MNDNGDIDLELSRCSNLKHLASCNKSHAVGTGGGSSTSFSFKALVRDPSSPSLAAAALAVRLLDHLSH